MTETFGPEYVRPPQPDCPDCDCCTAALCQKGATSVRQCQGHASAPYRNTVSACPCSAETTPGTAACRAAQVRVTGRAAQMPLPAEAETLLRDVAAGKKVAGVVDLAVGVHLHGLVTLAGESLAVTILGRTYLAARDTLRLPVLATVLDVDAQARTARVDVEALRPGAPVTVLLDQLCSDTGMTAERLVGRGLEVDAPCETTLDPDLFVLTGFRVPTLLPTAPAVGGEQ